jgi:hypothetical protein
MMSFSPSLFRSVPLAAIHGSTSLLGYTVPGWAATLSAVQPAKGEVPETCSKTPTVEDDPQAVEPKAKLDTANAARRTDAYRLCIFRPDRHLNVRLL